MKVHEPFQMLGLLDEDLKQALGIDVDGVYRRRTMFGFENKDWKSWELNGLEVLVPGMFNTTVDENGDTLIYPQGDRRPRRAAGCPGGSTSSTRSSASSTSTPTTWTLRITSRSSRPVRCRRGRDQGGCRCRACLGTGRDRELRRHGAGRHRAGARAFPQGSSGNSRRRRVVHVAQEPAGSTSTRSSSGRREIALENLARVHRAIGNTVDAVFLCGTDFGTQTSAFCSVPTFRELWLPYYKRIVRLDSRPHHLEVLQAFLRLGEAVLRVLRRGGARDRQPGPVLGDGDGPGPAEAGVRRSPHLLGRRRRYPADPPFRHARRGPRAGAPAVRDLRAGGRFRLQLDPQHPGGTPVQNIVAMFDAVHEFNGRN